MLVVGAGAVGSILALELAHHGVSSIVLDRAETPPQTTDVDYLDGRSMELLRRLRLSAAIRAQGVGPDVPDEVGWSQALDEPPVLVSTVPSLNELRGRYADVRDGSAPVELPQRVSGVRLAAQLRTAVEQHPLIDLRLGWTFSGARLEFDRVVAVALAHGAAPGRRRTTIEARYLAGCDGAQSTVRQCLQVPMEELSAPVQHCSVYFRSPELSRRFDGRHPATLIVGGLTLEYRDDGDLWVGHLRLASGDLTADPIALLRAELGGRLESAEVLDVRQWDDSLAVARRYRRGPAFLVGESAHRFYPAGDNAATSIEDAVDLGWKLAAVVNGWGGPGLLDSYEAERRPRALMDRELVARQLETRRRFGRLAAAGASREYLAGVLRQEVTPTDGALSTALASRYATSAVIWQDQDVVAPLGPGIRALPTTWTGGRAPAVRLDDGTPLFDRLGPQFTLVDLTENEAGKPLVLAAERRGIPMAHLVVGDRSVRTSWDRSLVLVRPDQHIAWRADAAPTDWNAVLDRVSGHGIP
ncbi:FAD-dependent oxidoreductase [Cryptosporangium minutisporangium]|uniref:FAD-dependent oxidoreductase n=1 Tax=Cryptosporangium minutisporangium TaxID=113569 RepID=A0ABP6T8J5_9ACTN